MLNNYFKIAIAVLLRRKFLTFVNLIATVLTLTVLVVAYAFVESIANPGGAPRRHDRMLAVQGAQFSAGTEADLAGRALGELDAPLASALATLAVDEMRMITDAAGRRLRCRRSQFSDRGFPRSYILIEELTAELNRSERETYEKLIRMMSHEVTNTVAATNSLLESCRTYAADLGAESRADYENALGVVITRNRNLNEFTKGFSDLVKLPEPQRENVDLRDLLHPLQTIFKAELERRNVSLDISVAADVPPVSLDRNQMEQVLLNVLRNAIEAIEHDGRIEIVVRHARGAVDLSVIDTGVGLTEEVKARLFTPFFTSKKRGQGLGLMLVKEILTQHGFAFSLDAAEGRTRFRIRIPAQQRGTGVMIAAPHGHR